MRSTSTSSPGSSSGKSSPAPSTCAVMTGLWKADAFHPDPWARWTGPACGMVAFLQGCPLRCAYCHNPDTWAFDGGTQRDAEELVQEICRFKPYFGTKGGVTVSGGEPLQQAAFVEELFRLLQSGRHPHGPGHFRGGRPGGGPAGACPHRSGFGRCEIRHTGRVQDPLQGGHGEDFLLLPDGGGNGCAPLGAARGGARPERHCGRYEKDQGAGGKLSQFGKDRMAALPQVCAWKNTRPWGFPSRWREQTTWTTAVWKNWSASCESNVCTGVSHRGTPCRINHQRPGNSGPFLRLFASFLPQGFGV